MNEFDVQLLIAFAIFCIIGVPVLLLTYKKYRRMKKSIKYLEFKIAILIAIPILSILLFLRKELSFLEKLSILILAFIGMVAYAYFITSARRSFRKIMGLPLEDEHTGEVIKEDKKDK